MPGLGLSCPGGAMPTGVSRCLAEASYERTLSVDGEETTLLVMDTWEPEQRVQQGRGWVLRGPCAASGAGCARTCPGDVVWAQPLLRSL